MIVVTGDFEKYFLTNRLIEEGLLDEAWSMLNQCASQTLKESFIIPSMNEVESIKEKIKFDGYYKGCDGNWHGYNDSIGGSSGGSGGGDCGICGTIFGIMVIIICSIGCSIHYGECCWSVWCEAICDCIDWCPCC